MLFSTLFFFTKTPLNTKLCSCSREQSSRVWDVNWNFSSSWCFLQTSLVTRDERYWLIIVLFLKAKKKIKKINKGLKVYFVFCAKALKCQTFILCWLSTFTALQHACVPHENNWIDPRSCRQSGKERDQATLFLNRLQKQKLKSNFIPIFKFQK